MRNKLVVVNPKDEKARKAKLNALNRWRRAIVGEDKEKGQEKEDKMILEKLHKVLDMKVTEVDEELEIKKKPLDRQIEVLQLERDHAAAQGLSTTSIDEKIEAFQHRITIMEKQRQLNKQPLMEKKEMVTLRYIHIGNEHEADRDYNSCKLKQAIVNHKNSKIGYQTDIKLSNVSYQLAQLQRSLSNLLNGSPDWERVSHQILALEAKEKKFRHQAQKERSKYEKLAVLLQKELEKLLIAKEKAERERKKQEEEKKKAEQGFSSDEGSDSDCDFSFFRRSAADIAKREKRRQEKREKVKALYTVV